MLRKIPLISKCIIEAKNATVLNYTFFQNDRVALHPLHLERILGNLCEVERRITDIDNIFGHCRVG
jgi:hypothetical protein